MIRYFFRKLFLFIVKNLSKGTSVICFVILRRYSWVSLAKVLRFEKVSEYLSPSWIEIQTIPVKYREKLSSPDLIKMTLFVELLRVLWTVL